MPDVSRSGPLGQLAEANPSSAFNPPNNLRVADNPGALANATASGRFALTVDPILTTRPGAGLGLPVRRTGTLKWYFPCVDEAQRLRGVVLESLDQDHDAKGLARHAYRSRTQFYRVFRAIIEESPVAMRRRLLLERAASQETDCEGNGSSPLRR